MNNDLDKIESDLKKAAEDKKKLKVSGRSVFKLKEIIAKKTAAQGQKKDDER